MLQNPASPSILSCSVAHTASSHSSPPGGAQIDMRLKLCCRSLAVMASAAWNVSVTGAQGSTRTPLSLKRPASGVSHAMPAATALACTLKDTSFSDACEKEHNMLGSSC